jgi:hypothetical protein
LLIKRLISVGADNLGWLLRGRSTLHRRINRHFNKTNFVAFTSLSLLINFCLVQGPQTGFCDGLEDVANFLRAG